MLKPRIQHHPQTPTPHDEQPKSEQTLRIDGLVTEERQLTQADLATLPRTGVAAEFHCDGKPKTTDRFWRGPRLVDVIGLAGPLPAAGYIRVGAGEYVAPLTREEAESAILADRVDDQPLAPENGGPWRLVLPGLRCSASVKWVDRLELAAEAGENMGLALVRARNRARRAQKQVS